MKLKLFIFTIIKQIILILLNFYLLNEIKTKEIFDVNKYTFVPTLLFISTVIFLIHDNYNILKILYYKYKNDIFDFIKIIFPDLSIYIIILDRKSVV